MHLPSAFGILLFCVLVDTSLSCSAKLSNFRWMKSDNNELLCGKSPPNKTKSVLSRVHCVSSCNLGCSSTCQAVNYWKNTNLCELFYYVPCSYDVRQDCANYQVVNCNLSVVTNNRSNHKNIIKKLVKLYIRLKTK